jgi:hypothetical protein
MELEINENAMLEGSCEYIELAAADRRQGVVQSLGVGRGAKNSSP